MLLVIYGGRNDGIFASTKNVALNDICIFNVNHRQWVSLAMYGIPPSSRWSHFMVPNRRYNPDGVVIFGGVSLKNYCKSRLHSFQILSYGAAAAKKPTSSSPTGTRRQQNALHTLLSKKSPTKTTKVRNSSAILMGDSEDSDGSDAMMEHTQKLQVLQSHVRDKVEIIKELFEGKEEET